jgi:hypothetical protein
MTTYLRKHKISFLVLILLGLTLISVRLYRSDLTNREVKVTTWDAFGYYMYLPSCLIYHDITKLEWLNKLDSTYHLTGGKLYQARIHKNGNYVTKYLGGVAIMQLPFFTLAHAYALNSSYPADGFSPPYQYAVAFAAVFYVFLGLVLLRILLLRYFSDTITALSLLILVLATNLIQYTSIEGGMSHAYIFFLYAVILLLTDNWHKRPQWHSALFIGLTLGLAVISRPTEIIMLFIPLLWGMQSKKDSHLKWQSIKGHYKQLFLVVFGGFLAMSPQLIYWYSTTDTLIYNTGSKWYFLNPFFRVLFGFENGWFIYTPAAILFVIGLFFLKKQPFRKSIITFALLNIWIVISWSDWKYGATYSTRALVQSYPVFALAMAAFLKHTFTKNWRYLIGILAIFFICSNLFQLHQYNQGIIHYRDMNRKFYARIYLNPSPDPSDMSLLDNGDYLAPAVQHSHSIFGMSQNIPIQVSKEVNKPILEHPIYFESDHNNWIKIKADIKSGVGFWNSYLACSYQKDSVWVKHRIRLFHVLAHPDSVNSYEFHVQIPDGQKSYLLKVFIDPDVVFYGTLIKMEIWKMRE